MGAKDAAAMEPAARLDSTKIHLRAGRPNDETRKSAGFTATVVATGYRLGPKGRLPCDRPVLDAMQVPLKVDVPIARLSGVGNGGGQVGFMVGVCEPFDAATLDRLYPGGKREYLKKFEASLASAIEAGFILPADRQEILDLAAIAYREDAAQPTAPSTHGCASSAFTSKVPS